MNMITRQTSVSVSRCAIMKFHFSSVTLKFFFSKIHTCRAKPAFS